MFHSHLTKSDSLAPLLSLIEEHHKIGPDIIVLLLKGKSRVKENLEEDEIECETVKEELNSDPEDMHENYFNDSGSDKEIKVNENGGDDLDFKPDGENYLTNLIKLTVENLNPVDLFSCDLCDYQAAKKATLNYHKRKHHSDITFSCTECNDLFETELKLKRHLVSKHDIDMLQCQHCEFKALKLKSIETHKMAKHKDLGYGKLENRRCDHCEKSFKNPSSLWSHTQRVHLDNPKYTKKPVIEKKDRTCPVCNAVMYLTQSQMTMHKQKCEFEKTGELKYVCEMCGRAFGTVHQQCSHRSQCSGKGKVKNKKCPHENCDYITRTRIELDNHVRQYHLNLPMIKDHICNHCGKAYNLLYQLKKHIKSVHLEIKPFICPECGKAFARKDKLQDHIDLHKGLFKYKCPFCQKGLNNSGALCNHKRICPSNPDRFASLNEARIAREKLQTK